MIPTQQVAAEQAASGICPKCGHSGQIFRSDEGLQCLCCMKTTYKSVEQLTPEELLLRAIFGLDRLEEK
mgnify:FL=1